MTDRVQFREDEGTLAFVRDLGLNPNQVAREAFEAEVRRLRAQHRHEKLQAAGIELPRPAAEMIREDRENH